MSYSEITDAACAAYHPVTARLMRQFRDGARGVRVYQFGGSMLAQANLTKNWGDSGTDGTVWFALATIKFEVHPALLGHAGADQFELSIPVYISGSGTTGTEIRYRLRDGTAVYSNVVEKVNPVAPAIDRFTATGVLPATGFRTWEVECQMEILTGPGSTAIARFQHRPGDSGAYLRAF